MLRGAARKPRCGLSPHAIVLPYDRGEHGASPRGLVGIGSSSFLSEGVSSASNSATRCKISRC